MKQFTINLNSEKAAGKSVAGQSCSIIAYFPVEKKLKKMTNQGIISRKPEKSIKFLKRSGRGSVFWIAWDRSGRKKALNFAVLCGTQGEWESMFFWG